MGGDNSGKRYLGTSVNVTRERTKRENAPAVLPCRFESKVNNKKLQETLDYVSDILNDAGISADSDILAYQLLTVRIKEYFELTQIISKQNFKSYDLDKDKETGEPIVKRKKIMKDYDKAAANLFEMLREFGMTPLTRNKIIRAMKETEESSGDDWNI